MSRDDERTLFDLTSEFRRYLKTDGETLFSTYNEFVVSHGLTRCSLSTSPFAAETRSPLVSQSRKNVLLKRLAELDHERGEMQRAVLDRLEGLGSCCAFAS